MQRTFFELIKRENERGAAVLFSSHILSEVQRLCNRVAIIKEGSIIALQKLDELKRDACKRVTVTVDGEFSPDGLEGLTDFKQSGGETSFLYRGDINALFKRLSGLNVLNADISEPTLEKIFLHYYN